MRLSITFISSLFLLLCSTSTTLTGQQDVSQEAYENIVDELGYDKMHKVLRPKPDTTKEEKSKRSRRSMRNRSDERGILSGAYSLLAYLAIGILVVVILYLIFSNVSTDKKIDEMLQSIEEIEDIADLDLEDLYAKAMAAGNRKAVIRIQFLKMLQKLSEKEIIFWEREKTNRDYHREIADATMRTEFRALATIYERVWYGDEILDKPIFDQYDGRFKDYIKQVS